MPKRALAVLTLATLAIRHRVRERRHDHAEVDGRPLSGDADAGRRAARRFRQSDRQRHVHRDAGHATNVFTWTGTFTGLTSNVNNGHIHGPFTPGGTATTANVILNFNHAAPARRSRARDGERPDRPPAA